MKDNPPILLESDSDKSNKVKLNKKLQHLVSAIKLRNTKEIELLIRYLYRANSKFGSPPVLVDLFSGNNLSIEDIIYLSGNDVSLSLRVDLLMAIHDASHSGKTPSQKEYKRKIGTYVELISNSINDGNHFNRVFYSDSLARFLSKIYTDKSRSSLIYINLLKLLSMNPKGANLSAYTMTMYEIKYELKEKMSNSRIDFISSMISKVFAAEDYFGIETERQHNIFSAFGSAFDELNYAIKQSADTKFADKCMKLKIKLANRFRVHAISIYNNLHLWNNTKKALLIFDGKPIDGKNYIACTDLEWSFCAFSESLANSIQISKIVNFFLSLYVQQGITSNTQKELARLLALVADYTDWGWLFSNLSPEDRIYLIETYKNTEYYFNYLARNERHISLINDLGV